MTGKTMGLGFLIVGIVVMAGAVRASDSPLAGTGEAVSNAPATHAGQANPVVEPVKDAPQEAPVAVTSNTPPVAEAIIIPEQAAAASPKSTSWQIGTRYTQVKLQDKSRGVPGVGSFFGTITQIKEKQDGAPNKVYLQYRLAQSPFWVGVSYDHVVAHTMDDLSLVPDGSGSDGDEDIQGAIPYLQAAWDNTTRFSPYAQVGYGFYQAKFKPNSWGDNGMRWVDAKKNVNGVELGGGLTIRLYKTISADLFAKYMKIDDIKGDWYYAYGVHGGPFVMTMSYVAYGAGLNWRF